MYFHGYFVLSTGPNWEYFSIISILWVILGLKSEYLTPGVPIYRAVPNCYVIDIEHISSRFNLDVFLWCLCVI